MVGSSKHFISKINTYLKTFIWDITPLIYSLKFSLQKYSIAGPSAEIDRFSVQKDIMAGTSAEIEKTFIDLLEGGGKIHWVGAAFSMVGFVLCWCIIPTPTYMQGRTSVQAVE